MAQPGISTGKPKSGAVMVALALGAVYIFWGGTYLGMRLAIETLPPFFMAGTRFLLAGGLLYAFARLRGAPRPALNQWRGTGTVGALLLVGGNGVVAWAEQRVPSGIASLLVALVPVWMVALAAFGRNRVKPTPGVLAGIALGLGGIALLVLQPGKSGSGALDLLGVAALVFASLSWATGSLYSRRAPQPDSPLLSTAMQMLVGGTLLFILSAALGEFSRVDLQAVSARSLIGLGYLIFFGSIVAYNAFIWLMKHAEPSLVSTYAFVNPVIAVLLGWLILGESLSLYSILGAVIIVGAVVVITLTRNRKA